MNGDQIRVLLVDDHPALREGTANLLEREPDLHVIGGVGTLADAQAAVSGREPPDVLVLDIRLGGERGLDLLGESRSGGARRPAVVVWTAYDVPQYVAYAFKAGAAAFVVKTQPTSELVRAIREAASGGVHFATHPDLDARLLSDREREVLGHLIEGLSNDEIAGVLDVTTRAVEAHLTRLFEQFDARSRTDLAARAAREGWLDIPPKAPADRTKR